MIPKAGILFLSLAIVAAYSLPARSASWGPWSVSRESPVLLTPADREAATATVREPEVPPIAATPFLWSIRFFQTFISPVDGDRCPMYPTCSAYGVQAFKKHGPLIGVIMTADRLIHELDEQRYAPLRKFGNRFRFDDPVSNNDFWWFSP